MGITGYMAAGMAVLIIAFGVYFKYSQAQLAGLNQEIAVQTTKAAIAKANFDTLSNSVQQQAEALSDLAVEQQEIRKQSLRVAEIFSKHDLAKLAAAKPGMIETIINNGTEDVLNELRGME